VSASGAWIRDTEIVCMRILDTDLWNVADGM
jgi:hypothetical protein